MTILDTHGDPAKWSDDEYEDFFDFATPDPHTQPANA
jgi:hypothetical protein